MVRELNIPEVALSPSLVTWRDHNDYGDGDWTVLMFNTSAPFVGLMPVAYSGMSKEGARRKMRELRHLCSSYDGQYKRTGRDAYAWIAEIHPWGGGRLQGHHIICMTDQAITFPVRALKQNQMVL